MDTDTELAIIRQNALRDLCWFDPRRSDWDGKSQRNDDGKCWCDACYQGRDRQAVLILQLVDRVNKKVFVCTGFTGYYPVGTAAVVMAENAEQAAKMLGDELKRIKLKQPKPGILPDAMQEFTDGVEILCDGNY